MLKTFLLSLAIGAISAVIGWTSSILLESALSEETFESLVFGWEGLLVGSIAIVTIFMLLATKGSVEPLMTALVAAAGGALLWSRRELPIAGEANFQGTPTYYWATLSMMATVLLLLFLGLRAARTTNSRARAS